MSDAPSSMNDTPSSANKNKKRSHSFWLSVLILGAMVLGIFAGQWVYGRYGNSDHPSDITALNGYIAVFDFVGSTIFMGLLKMVLIPLVASSVIVGVSSVGDPRQLGYVGGMTVLYYFSTMMIAVLMGLFLVTTIRPGVGIGEQFRNEKVAEFQQTGSVAKERMEEAQGTGILGAFRALATQLIPNNPVAAAAEGKMLPVISFSLLLGIVLAVIGERGQALTDVFEALFAAVMKLVEWILWLAPIGVFALMAWAVSRIGLRALIGPLALFVVTVLVGLAIHGTVILPTVLALLGRTNPARFAMQMKEALLTALATDSSSATLPVTIECAEGPGGCSRRASRFVLPLGATVNMDGTALYEAVAVVFLFQCFGIELGGTELAIIAITATLAAVGAAGIPSAGLVTMVIVVEAVNSSLGGTKMLPLASVGIILGIDRLLDMCRTVVNVWGDAVGAKIMTRIAPDD
jgi:Na+/H+-dicarboxylate symporter